MFIKQSHTDTSAKKPFPKWKGIGGVLLTILVVGGFIFLLIVDHLEQGYSLSSIFLPQ